MAINADIRVRMFGADSAGSEMAKLAQKTEQVKKDAGEANTDELTSSAKESNEAVGDIRDNLGSLVKGASIAAIGAGLVKLGTGAADAAVEVDVLATSLDIPVEEASRLAAVFGQVGIEANDLTDIALQIAGAIDGDAEAARRLGLTLEEAEAPVAALKAGIDKWDFLSATERSQYFGEEGVRQISAIVAKGEDLEDLLEGVDPGLIFDEREVAQAREFQAELAKANASLDAAKTNLGQSIIPLLGYAASAANAWIDAEGQAEYDAAVRASAGEVQGLADAVLDLAKDSDASFGRQQISVGSVELALLDLKGEASLTGEEFTETGLKGVEAMTDVEIAAGRAKEAMNDWKNSLNIDAAAAQLEAAFHGAMLNNEEDAAAAERATINWLEQLGDVPEEVITDIRAEFDEGSLASIFASLDAIRREAGRPIPLGRYVPPSGFQPGAPDGAQRTTNVNVTMAGTPSSRELASTLAYWEARG